MLKRFLAFFLPFPHLLSCKLKPWKKKTETKPFSLGILCKQSARMKLRYAWLILSLEYILISTNHHAQDRRSVNVQVTYSTYQAPRSNPIIARRNQLALQIQKCHCLLQLSNLANLRESTSTCYGCGIYSIK